LAWTNPGELPASLQITFIAVTVTSSAPSSTRATPAE
jgi:hypothetical protein